MSCKPIDLVNSDLQMNVFYHIIFSSSRFYKVLFGCDKGKLKKNILCGMINVKKNKYIKMFLNIS